MAELYGFASSPAQARTLMGAGVKIIQYRNKEQAGAHYVGAGAVYGSVTKPEAPTMGLPLLRDICRTVSVPVSAIGGIRYETPDEIIGAGAGYVCVISDIHDHPDPAGRARRYLRYLKERS